MNHAADNTSLQPSDAKDLAWDEVDGDDLKVKRACTALVAKEYPFLTTAADFAFALYRGIIGPAEIDTQVRELIAREASKLRRVK